MTPGWLLIIHESTIARQGFPAASKQVRIANGDIEKYRPRAHRIYHPPRQARRSDEDTPAKTEVHKQANFMGERFPTFLALFRDALAGLDSPLRDCSR